MCNSNRFLKCLIRLLIKEEAFKIANEKEGETRKGNSQTEEFWMGPNMKTRITCSNIVFFDQTQITSSVLFLFEDEEDKGNLVHKLECNIAILIGSIDTPKLCDRHFANTPIINGCICKICF